jgi:hypothetical protein
VLAERLIVAKRYLDDARYLLAARRLESAVSRAYYAAYQGMWAAPWETLRKEANGGTSASLATSYGAIGVSLLILRPGQVSWSI